MSLSLSPTKSTTMGRHDVHVHVACNCGLIRLSFELAPGTATAICRGLSKREREA